MSTPSARAEVLARISTSQRRTGAPDDSGVVPAAPTAPRATAPADPEPQPDADRLIELLTDRLLDYDATVSLLPADAVPGRIAELLADAGTVVVPHDLDPAVLAELAAAALPDSADAAHPVEVLDSVDAVITASTLAIADTGTIVLSGPQCGRRAITLVPDRHVCLVRTSDIVHRVPAAVRIIEERGLVEAPQTWVSGPSATSDIELERVAGVHGPRTLDVILVRD